MFGFGKQKKQPESPRQPEPPVNDPTTARKEWMYRALFPDGSDIVCGPEGVELPGMGLKLRVDFPQETPQMLQMEVNATCPAFTDDIVEFLVAGGQDQEKKLNTLAYQTQQLVLAPLLQGLARRDGEAEEVSVAGFRHRFRSYRSNTVCLCREQALAQQITAEGDLWTRLRAEILPFVGRKRNYWLKLYQSHFGDRIISEARLNNRIIPELTQLLVKDAERRPYTDWDQKQTILLLQDPETCLEAPFTARQVREFAGQAIHLYAGGMEDDEVYDRLLALTGDLSLSFDLTRLIPELFCFMCVRDANTVVPRITFSGINGAERNPAVLGPQIGCYSWCEEAVERYLYQEQPDEGTLRRLVNLSASAGAFLSAVNDGADPRALKHIMLFSPPEGYILR